MTEIIMSEDILLLKLSLMGLAFVSGIFIVVWIYYQISSWHND